MLAGQVEGCVSGEFKIGRAIGLSLNELEDKHTRLLTGDKHNVGRVSNTAEHHCAKVDSHVNRFYVLCNIDRCLENAALGVRDCKSDSKDARWRRRGRGGR